MILSWKNKHNGKKRFPEWLVLLNSKKCRLIENFDSTKKISRINSQKK